MRYAFVLPGGTAPEQLEQALLAEQAGWDGVFVWEAGYGVDAWTLLAAIAQRTERLRLGTMLTPLPWRRPWKLASQVVTLDQLSGGRAVLSVGLGATDAVLGRAGEVTDRRTRAERLDEGIDLMYALWRGELAYSGRHYDIDFSPRQDLPAVAMPVQQPRIPIWVVGAWPRLPSMRRARRCDGILPVCMDENGFRETRPDDIRDIRAWLTANGPVVEGFDVVVEMETPADDAAKAADIAAPWQEAGVTWLVESRWQAPEDAAERNRIVRERLAAGPPRP